MNTFATPRWLKVEASRLYLRSVVPELEPTLSDDEVVDVAMKVAAETVYDEDEDEDE